MQTGNSGAQMVTGAFLASNSQNFSPLQATVTALADVGEIDVSEASRIFIQLAASVAPLSAFEVHFKGAPDANYVPLLKVAADYTSPIGLVVGASGDLTTLAINTDGWLMLDVRGISKIKLRAAGTATPLTAKWAYN